MKKLLSIILSLVLIATFVLPLYVSAEETTQSNITTNFDEKTGTFTISGKGKVEKLLPYDDVNDGVNDSGTFDNKRIDNKIKHIVIGEGITEIDNSLNYLDALEDVILPSTLKKLSCAFYKCNKLESVNIPYATNDMYFSFSGCSKLKDVTLNAKIFISQSFNGTAIEEIFIPRDSVISLSFNHCKNLKEVILAKDVHVEGTTYNGPEGEADYSWSFTNCHKGLIIYGAITRNGDGIAIQTPLQIEADSEDDAGKNNNPAQKQTNNIQNIFLICLMLTTTINTVLLVVLIIGKRKKPLIKNDDNYEENN